MNQKIMTSLATIVNKRLHVPTLKARLQKRPRNYNFTLQEKMHFLDILQQYIGITESRRLDSPMINQKRKIWDTMVQKYNGMFPMGPKRDRAQLKDLYRRMKILARKVQKQRLSGLQENEALLAPDESTERLIEMMFTAQDFGSSFSIEDMDVKEDDSLEEDMKPIILHPLDDNDEHGIVVADQHCENGEEVASFVRNGEEVASFVRNGEEGASFVRNGVNNTKRNSKKKSKSSSLGSNKLPIDVEITPVSVSLPVHPLNANFPEITTGSSFSNDSFKNDVECISWSAEDQGITSSQLNQKLLKMAEKEHLIKMKVHEASLELLLLQKRKLLQEFDEA